MPHDPTDDWTPVGIVFDGDPIEVDGINPWLYAWRSTGERAQVRHPAYPTQVHEVDVHEVTVDGRTIRFAAGELSNTVWGFYREWR